MSAGNEAPGAYWILLLALIGGCSYLTDASKEECEAAVDNSIRVDSEEVAGDGFFGRSLELAGQGVRRASGARADEVRACMAKFSSAKARCVATARDADSLRECK